MMSRPLQTASRIARIGLLATGCAGLLLGLGAVGHDGGMSRHRATGLQAGLNTFAGSEEATGASRLLLEGDRALAEGWFPEADALYREAWVFPALRQQAADALHRLHAMPGFELTADEEQVSQTLCELGPGFSRMETNHFVILSDCPPQWVRTRAELLERTREQVFRVAAHLDVAVHPHRHKLVCVLINDHARYREFAQAHDGLETRWIAGYYATPTNRVVFYNDETSPAYERIRSRLDRYESQRIDARERAQAAERELQHTLAERLHGTADELDERIRRERQRLDQRATAFSLTKTIHEAVHLVSFNIGLQRPDRDYPFWFSEGLATSFETDSPVGVFGPDTRGSARRHARFHELRRSGRLTSLSRLATLGEPVASDSVQADAMYTQSHALFVHLFQAAPEELGRFIQALADEPPGRITPERHLELFRSHFGEPGVVARRMMSGGP